MVSLQANGVPLCMVTRLIAKILEHCQRLREYDISYPDNDNNDPSLVYKETRAILEAKLKLLKWTREEQSMAGIQWVRGYEMAVKSGVFRLNGNEEKLKSAFSPVEKSTAAYSGRNDRKVSIHDAFDIDKSKWRHKYGISTQGDKRVELCWFYANAPRQCTRNNCNFAHQLPSSYDGKAYQDHSAAKQAEIFTSCQ